MIPSPRLLASEVSFLLIGDNLIKKCSLSQYFSNRAKSKSSSFTRVILIVVFKLDFVLIAPNSSRVILFLYGINQFLWSSSKECKEICNVVLPSIQEKSVPLIPIVDT